LAYTRLKNVWVKLGHGWETAEFQQTRPKRCGAWKLSWPPPIYPRPNPAAINCCWSPA